jgi:hypothetical protein
MSTASRPRQRRSRSAGQLFDLYLYAKEQKLAAKAKELLKEIVKLEPDHEAARKELGHVKHEGKWMPEAEAKKLAKSDEEKQMKEKGLVRYKDKWVTPEEKESLEHTAKGEVLVDGKWVSQKDLDRAQAEAKLREEAKEHKAKGEYYVNGQWMPKAEAEKHYSDINTPYRTDGDHVALYTNKGIDLGERVLVETESAYRDCAAFFGTELTLSGARMPIFVTATLDDMNTMANAMGVDEKSSVYHAWCSPWLPANPQGFDIVSTTMYYRDKAGKDVLTDIFARHALAEQYVERMVGKDATDIPPSWFIDGFACYIERWNTPRYFDWSRDVLRQKGALPSLKVFLGSYTITEPSILTGGLVVAFLRSEKAPEEVKTAWNESLEALRTKGKIGKAFKKLEKALIAAEEAFIDFSETKQHQG